MKIAVYEVWELEPYHEHLSRTAHENFPRIIHELREHTRKGVVGLCDKIVHGDLSYILMGILFDVHHSLGGGFQEKYYYKAIKNGLDQAKIPYLEQVRTDLEIGGYNLGRYYIDFIIDNKIVLEIKAKQYFIQKDIRQVLAYLKKTGLQLGILAGFSREGVKYKRILKGK